MFKRVKYGCLNFNKWFVSSLQPAGANSPKPTSSSSLVSQILQSGTLLSQQGLLRGGLVRVSGNGQVMISGQQPVRAGAQGQHVRVASPAGAQMRLMSIPTGALGQATRIIVPDQSSLVMAGPIPQSVPGKRP